jgi:hypothetical protein
MTRLPSATAIAKVIALVLMGNNVYVMYSFTTLPLLAWPYNWCQVFFRFNTKTNSIRTSSFTLELIATSYCIQCSSFVSSLIGLTQCRIRLILFDASKKMLTTITTRYTLIKFLTAVLLQILHRNTSNTINSPLQIFIGLFCKKVFVESTCLVLP